jgi:hypothetical protein
MIGQTFAAKPLAAARFVGAIALFCVLFEIIAFFSHVNCL